MLERNEKTPCDGEAPSETSTLLYRLSNNVHYHYDIPVHSLHYEYYMIVHHSHSPRVMELNSIQLGHLQDVALAGRSYG